MFVLLFIILFHNAETELIRLVKLKPYDKLILKPCPKGWVFQSSDPKNLSQSLETIFKIEDVGFYMCPDGDKFFALAITDILKFKVTNELGKHYMVGEKLKVNCSVEFHPGSYLHGHAYTLVTDSSNEEIVKKYLECQIQYCTLISYKDITLVKPGSETYACKFNFQVLKEQMNVDYSELLNETIYVYMAPTNVRPDLKVKKLDTPINCTADGDPSPTIFKWTCEGIGWQSEGHQLKIQDYGEYYCICTANNTIKGTAYGGLWNGTITIMAGAERRIPNGITFLTVILAQIVQHVK